TTRSPVTGRTSTTPLCSACSPRTPDERAASLTRTREERARGGAARALVAPPVPHLPDQPPRDRRGSRRRGGARRDRGARRRYMAAERGRHHRQPPQPARLPDREPSP